MKNFSDRLPYLREFARTHDVLHVGAGREGFGTTLDISPAVSPSILADLAKPLPIEDNAYAAVYAFSILEHITNLVALVDELYRVIRPGGFLAVLVPHFSSLSAHVDPTHVRGFSVKTFDYFVQGSELQREFGWYSEARFTKRAELMTFQSRVVNRLAGGYINRHNETYEAHFAYIIRASGIYWELAVQK